MGVLVDLVGVIVGHPDPLPQLGQVHEQGILVVGSLLSPRTPSAWNLQ